MSDKPAWKLEKATKLDPKAVKLMKDIIGQHYPRLNQFRVKIVLLFRSEPASAGGKERLGTAYKCSERERLLSKVDGCIVIAHSWWLENPDRHAALLDHELGHSRVDDDGVLSVVSHDVEEHIDVWERRGPWNSSLRRAETVMGQMRLPEMGDDETAGDGGDDDNQDHDAHDDTVVSIEVVATGQKAETTIGGMREVAAGLAADSAGNDEL